MARRIVVIGLGNRLRGDDAAALLALDGLDLGPEVELIAHEGEADLLLDRWQGAAAVILLDSLRSGAEPGSIRRFDVAAGPLPVALTRTIGHGVGLAEAIELARALHRLPPRVVVLTLEGTGFGLGDPLSPAVERGMAELRAALVREVRELGQQAP